MAREWKSRSLNLDEELDRRLVEYAESIKEEVAPIIRRAIRTYLEQQDHVEQH